MSGRWLKYAQYLPSWCSYARHRPGSSPEDTWAALVRCHWRPAGARPSRPDCWLRPRLSPWPATSEIKNKPSMKDPSSLSIVVESCLFSLSHLETVTPIVRPFPVQVRFIHDEHSFGVHGERSSGQLEPVVLNGVTGRLWKFHGDTFLTILRSLTCHRK